MNSVFVTGASGFVGRHLVNALVTRGCHVRCLVRHTSSMRHLVRAGVDLCFGDVSSPEALAAAMVGTDVVFHAAGLTHALHAADLMRVNGEGTRNVAWACQQQPRPPVLVMVSSLAAAGPTARGGVRCESDPPAPVSNYGRSKRAGEFAAVAWADRLPITIVRPGIVFGPANREMLDVFRLIHLARVHVVPTFCPPPLSLIHVEDLAQILILAAERGRRIVGPQGTRGPVNAGVGYYFACVPEYPNWAQFGRLVAEVLGYHHLCLWHLAEPLPWLVAAVSELIAYVRGKPFVLSLDKIREAMVPSWASSPAAVTRELGFTAPQNLRERLEETVAWYRRHRWLRGGGDTAKSRYGFRSLRLARS